MSYIVDGLCLSMAMTPALLFYGAVAGALAGGRIKTEPNEPWIVFRQEPIRFLRVVSFYMVAAILFSVATVKVAVGVLR